MKARSASAVSRAQAKTLDENNGFRVDETRWALRSKDYIVNLCELWHSEDDIAI
jgi:hypothetical protein